MARALCCHDEWPLSTKKTTQSLTTGQWHHQGIHSTHVRGAQEEVAESVCVFVCVCTHRTVCVCVCVYVMSTVLKSLFISSRRLLICSSQRTSRGEERPGQRLLREGTGGDMVLLRPALACRGIQPDPTHPPGQRFTTQTSCPVFYLHQNLSNQSALWRWQDVSPNFVAPIIIPSAMVRKWLHGASNHNKVGQLTSWKTGIIRAVAVTENLTRREATVNTAPVITLY